MKQKIIFFEPEITEGRGHHLDNLIESSIFFKKKKIIWFINNQFKKNLFIPRFIIKYAVIDSYKTKTIFKKVIKFFLEFFIFFKFFYFFYQKKKLKNYLIALKNNYFSIPEYFFSFYKTYVKLNLNSNDFIIVQSCRPKDIELLHFINIIEENTPTFILRILYPPKRKKNKNFYYFAENLKKIKKNFFIFTEVSSVNKFIRKNSKILKPHNFAQIYCFFNRKFNNKINIGFLGESRLDKGFDKIPELISKTKKIDQNIEFTIQFSKFEYPNTSEIKKKILELSEKYDGIKIYDGYLDFKIYRKLLQKINIMPILYDVGQVNTVGSGIFFSCITHEIPMIIPYQSNQLKNYLIPGSYQTASNLDDYIKKIFFISKNYKKILKTTKKLSKKYRLQIKRDPVVKLINLKK